MRLSIALISGCSIAWSMAFGHGQVNQSQERPVPIVQPSAISARITGSSAATSDQATQEQSTQPSPGDRQAPQVPMPTLANQQPGAQDVPAPPLGGGQAPVGPALQVQSNAATMPDDYYLRRGQRPLGEPFQLFGQTAGGFEMGGWTDTGYYSDNDGVWNNYDDGYRLNQAWLYAERKAPRCGDLGLGFRLDGLYGADAQYIQAIGNPPAGAPEGWDNEWDHGPYAWALPQAYGEIAWRNWSFIGGKYLNPMGYESVMSPKNFFFSRSYSRGKIQPQSFTGTHSRFNFSDDLTILTGANANWDTGFDRFNDSLSYFGGFEFKPCAPVNVSGYAAFGDFGYREDGWLNNLIVDVMLTDKLNYISEWTFEDSDIEYQFSWANYFIYRASERLGLGSRLEWFKSTIYSGTADSTYQWTTGVNYRANANIRFRPELRVDWGEGALDAGQPIFASDLIITF